MITKWPIVKNTTWPIVKNTKWPINKNTKWPIVCVSVCLPYSYFSINFQAIER